MKVFASIRAMVRHHQQTHKGKPTVGKKEEKKWEFLIEGRIKPLKSVDG